MKRTGAVMIRSVGAFGLLFAVTPALAADPLPPITARLTYTRPPGCPPESELRYEVARRLGQALAEPASPVAVNTVAVSTPTIAVAPLPVPQESSAIPPESSARHRKLSAEQQSFDDAHQAFLRGSFKEALAALKAQERAYPAGELAAERETLRRKIARLGDASEF